MKIESFFNRKIPRYAILSHCWGEDEVLLQDFMAGAGHKAGFKKIIDVCKLAREEYDLDWAWVDTCCIDKTSSAELSESINSMCKWYKQSVVCYAFLSDVSIENYGWMPHFLNSRWFTRGWTLQELLAPPTVRFFDKDLRYISTKRGLAEKISSITQIPWTLLHGSWDEPDGFRGPSVADRMSWASRRQTTREEDMAYCLLGIFNVNMPLIYGEGSKAFQRLQEQIIASSTDESIFAWMSERADEDETQGGLLASSPADFAHSNSIVPMKSRARPPTIAINNGIQIHYAITDLLDLTRYGVEWLVGNSASADTVYLDLNCFKLIRGESPQWITIPLESKTTYDGTYCRVDRTSLLMRKVNLSLLPRYYAKIFVSRLRDNPRELNQVDALSDEYRRQPWFGYLQTGFLFRLRIDWAAVMLSSIYLDFWFPSIPDSESLVRWVLYALSFASLCGLPMAAEVLKEWNWSRYKCVVWFVIFLTATLPGKLVAGFALYSSIVNVAVQYRPLRPDDSGLGANG